MPCTCLNADNRASTPPDALAGLGSLSLGPGHRPAQFACRTVGAWRRESRPITVLIAVFQFSHSNFLLFSWQIKCNG